jgi:hypothetical protein
LFLRGTVLILELFDLLKKEDSWTIDSTNGSFSIDRDEDDLEYPRLIGHELRRFAMNWSCNVEEVSRDMRVHRAWLWCALYAVFFFVRSNEEQFRWRLHVSVRRGIALNTSLKIFGL